jgi:hypothetical protein
VVALFHQEQFVSHKKEYGKDSNLHLKVANKFIVNMNPRVLLIPSISTESGPIVDYTLTKSPAQHILVIIIPHLLHLSNNLIVFISVFSDDAASRQPLEIMEHE